MRDTCVSDGEKGIQCPALMIGFVLALQPLSLYALFQSLLMSFPILEP